MTHPKLPLIPVEIAKFPHIWDYIKSVLEERIRPEYIVLVPYKCESIFFIHKTETSKRYQIPISFKQRYKLEHYSAKPTIGNLLFKIPLEVKTVSGKADPYRRLKLRLNPHETFSSEYILSATEYLKENEQMCMRYNKLTNKFECYRIFQEFLSR